MCRRECVRRRRGEASLRYGHHDERRQRLAPFGFALRGEAPVRRRARRRRRTRLDREALAPLQTAAADDAAAIVAAHALQEAMDAESATALWLPGSLHRNTLLRATLNLAPA